MSDPNVLSYADLKAAIYERRFPSSSPVSQWLAAAYADVWSAADWTFNKVRLYDLYATADGTSSGQPSQTPPLPSDFAAPSSQHYPLWRADTGDPLELLTNEQFSLRYRGTQSSSGPPEACMLINRTLRIGPLPDAVYKLTLDYRRRLCTRTGTGTTQTGFFQADTDIPLWDDHHYLLVLRAKLIGLRDRSDPTASDLDGEYMRLLEAMKDDYAEMLPRGLQMPAWR